MVLYLYFLFFYCVLRTTSISVKSKTEMSDIEQPLVCNHLDYCSSGHWSFLQFQQTPHMFEEVAQKLLQICKYSCGWKIICTAHKARNGSTYLMLLVFIFIKYYIHFLCTYLVDNVWLLISQSLRMSNLMVSSHGLAQYFRYSIWLYLWTMLNVEAETVEGWGKIILQNLFGSDFKS